VFDRTPDGRINQRNFGGHRYPRLAHVGDRTGLELIRSSRTTPPTSASPCIWSTRFIELLLDGGRAAGAVAYDRERGRFHIFAARAVILATGAPARLKITSNSWEGTGDGHALAYRAGAELMDMEFIQFHPTGMVWPPSVRGILVTEGVRGEEASCATGKDAASCSTDIPTNYKSRRPRRTPRKGGGTRRANKSRAARPSC